jgi:H+-transporting ATPase
MLITLLNDGTLISIGYDSVIPSKFPNVWNLPALFAVSAVLAGVALFSSLILLYLCLDSWNPNGFFQSTNSPGLTYGQITTVIYLKVSISDFLTLFSARTDGFFWTSSPSPILLGAGAVALSISTILACAWPDGPVDGIEVTGLALREPKALAVYVWLYCIFWWFIQDGFKVLTYHFLKKYNIFGINDSLMIGKGRVADSFMGATEKNPMLDEESGK